MYKENGVGSDDVHYTDNGYEQISKFIIAYLDREIKESDKKKQI